MSGFINLKKSSEAIVSLSSTAYAASWVGGNKIMVINTINDSVKDSIEVGVEPESMVIDKNETLWVLCNGGWKRENFAQLIAINTKTNTIEKRFIFPSVTDSPTCLQINGTGETLYFLQNGVRRMEIDASDLPSEVFISEQNNVFYRMGVNPSNGEVFVTDAGDYVDRGKVLRYSREGVFISEMIADIIPGNLCFKINPDPNTPMKSPDHRNPFFVLQVLNRFVFASVFLFSCTGNTAKSPSDLKTAETPIVSYAKRLKIENWMGIRTSLY